jgi:membrane protease YdiL (CAAX protease family)
LRGYALSRSQSRRGLLLASLIIGVLWAGWHIPILIGQDVVTIVFFSVYTIALSFLFTWLFNHANEAVWVVALLHATINASDAAFEVILPGLEGVEWQLPALLAFIVVSIGSAVAIWRGQRRAALPDPNNSAG